MFRNLNIPWFRLSTRTSTPVEPIVWPADGGGPPLGRGLAPVPRSACKWATTTLLGFYGDLCPLTLSYAQGRRTHTLFRSLGRQHRSPDPPQSLGYHCQLDLEAIVTMTKVGSVSTDWESDWSGGFPDHGWSSYRGRSCKIEISGAVVILLNNPSNASLCIEPRETPYYSEPGAKGKILCITNNYCSQRTFSINGSSTSCTLVLIEIGEKEKMSSLSTKGFWIGSPKSQTI